MANYQISTTLEDICSLFESEKTNVQDLISFFRSTDMTFEVYILNDVGIANIDDLKKWENPKTKVSYVDKSRVVYTTKSGRPIYGKKRKYPNALNGRQIVGALKTFPKNVTFYFNRHYGNINLINEEVEPYSQEEVIKC